MKYSKPTIEKIADFKNDTNGIWFGRFVDIFGGRAVVKITIQY
ncbi:hypothetical protein FUSO7_05620 [Fusobacterium necrophorum BFTR-2]|nr:MULTISPECIES: lasso RiPP family leader peptide-containing protein [Bacteria]KDE73918.1 hypothetical protein FUSO7_05620 [Fusobacterium necrophorum BFTR-2]